MNSYTQDDTYPLPDLQSVFQRVGRSNLISVCVIVEVVIGQYLCLKSTSG